MTTKQLFLPALRGFFGDWVYYSCLMPISEVNARVQFAKQLHQNKRLSQWIQRPLDEKRIDDIAKYLQQPQRFFNSLVLAVYGGAPAWYEAGDIRPASRKVKLPEIPENTRFSIGFLCLRGNEKLFALDGQHRLAGIKRAIHRNTVPDDDDASIVFVAHKNTRPGMERTRRLFTTLNKTPVHVAKSDLIALDEDDVMAICVRRLVEKHRYFQGDRLAFNRTSNLNRDDQTSFTSIVNLYDVLLALFREHPRRVKTKELRFRRPASEELDQYYALAESYFETLAAEFPDLHRYMKARRFDRVCASLRGPFGGHILFRPVGLAIMTKLVAQAMHKHQLRGAIGEIARLPKSLAQPPYANVLFNVRQRRMIPDGAALVHRILAYMLGAPTSPTRLRREYAKALEVPIRGTRLPKRVSNALADSRKRRKRTK